MSFLKSHPPASSLLLSPAQISCSLSCISLLLKRKEERQFVFCMATGCKIRHEGCTKLSQTPQHFGQPTAPLIPALYSQPGCLYMRIATLLHSPRFVLTLLRPFFMAVAHSSEKSGRIFSHVLSNDIKKSRSKRGGHIIGWLASDGLKTFRGRVEGYCAPSRNTVWLHLQRRLLSQKKKKRKGRASVLRATAACQDPTPLNLPSQTAGHQRSD